VIPSQLLNPILPGLDDPSIFLPSGKPKMRLVLRLGQRRVFVYRNDQQVASYPVAVGKAGWETPTGQFKVIQMVENPVWQNPWTGEVRPPGPDSALGLRWIGFWTDGKDTIGFHGTPTINSIGQAASHGCVRMRNEDVVALFNQVEMGTLVVVEP
jgi:lipoprotein-anchoring transpeptidase ErfK/SrfK